MWIAEFCQFYGVSDEYVLRMPAIRFFSLLSSCREIKAMDLIDQADIGAISIFGKEWVLTLQNDFKSRFPSAKKEADDIRAKVESNNAQIKKTQELKGAQGLQTMQGLFAGVRR